MTQPSGRKLMAFRFQPLVLIAALLVAGAPYARAEPPVPEAKAERPPPIAPAAPVTAEKQTLSQQLYQSNGVIVPPKKIDPGIRKPTPDMGPSSTPVIKPPGSVGGDPNLQPK